MKKKWIILAVVVCCIVPLFWLHPGRAGAAPSSNGSTADSAAATSQSIREKQDQIAKAEQEKKNLKNNLSSVEEIKKGLETKKKDLSNYVVELDTQLAAIEERVNSLKEQIVVKESEIEETQRQLEAAVDREENQMESMIVKAQQMYEKKDTYALELLAQATGLGDFLNRAEYMERLVTYDKQQWNEYLNIRKLVELCEKQLELEKDILDQTKENVELEQSTIEYFIEQKQQDIIAYQSDINNKEAAIEEYKALIKQQDEEIQALEKAIEEEKKKLQGLKRTYDGGTFKFPLANYTRVSCDYGNRIHPSLNIPHFHNGVDFAAPKGTAIYAAYDGEVVAATYSPSMGNYVMIDHGDNLYTIYMHASTLKVSKGDVVSRGDTVALVGSTGNSTGNHLHFSVRKNGSYVSPWEYITL